MTKPRQWRYHYRDPEHPTTLSVLCDGIVVAKVARGVWFNAETKKLDDDMWLFWTELDRHFHSMTGSLADVLRSVHAWVLLIVEKRPGEMWIQGKGWELVTREHGEPIPLEWLEMR